MKKWLTLLSYVLVYFGLSASEGPILQATIGLTSSYAAHANTKGLQPSMPVLLQTTIKNVGDQLSVEGEVLVRFTLPEPLGKKEMFTTERAPLPSLSAGQEIIITFKTPQELPDLTDFLRNDWPMHRYETVAFFDSQAFVLGTDTITFSAHYYLGPNKPLPTVVPSTQQSN